MAIEIVDFPIKNGDFPWFSIVMLVYQKATVTNSQKSHGKYQNSIGLMRQQNAGEFSQLVHGEIFRNGIERVFPGNVDAFNQPQWGSLDKTNMVGWIPLNNKYENQGSYSTWVG